MRITIITQWFYPEPPPVPSLPLASWFTERGHSVEVITGFPNYPGGKIYPGYSMRPFQRETVDGVDILRVPVYPSHDRSAVRRIGTYASFALSTSTLGLLLAKPTDVIYACQAPNVGVAALLAQRFRNTPFLYHIADMWPDSVTESGMISSERARRIVERLLSRWCAMVYNGAGHIVVPSPGSKRLLIERGVSPDAVDVIFNWADEDNFYPQPRNEGLAQTLGLAGRFNVMYAGNLGYFQGLDTAILAAHAVRHLERFQLVFVGTGPVEADLRSLVHELELSNVRFVDRLPYDGMGPVTNLADVQLVSLRDLPFFEATIPSKMQVALASGRPILMAVGGDAAEVVRASGGGIHCPPGDVPALAAAFERLCSMPESQLATMGSSGRAYYLEHLSLASAGSRLEQLLTSLVRSPPGSVGNASDAP